MSPKSTPTSPKESEITLRLSETQELPDLTRNSQKDTSTTEDLEPAESKDFVLFLSDGPRKDGGGKGNIGNMDDLLHKEKYANL